MTGAEIEWSTLTNDHDKEIYLAAFWHGVNVGKVLEEKMRTLESRWKIECDTTVQRT